MIYKPAEDSELLARHLGIYVKGKSFLDMGAGSGIQSERARKEGASSIVAADIDRKSVNYVRKKGFKTLHSNLFASIKGKFNVIAFNPPYLPYDAKEDSLSRRSTTGGKTGDELTVRFIQGLSSHLALNGVALIIVSSLTCHDRIEAALKKEKLHKRVIDNENFFMESIELWELTRKPQ